MFRWEETYDKEEKSQNMIFHDNLSNLKLAVICSGLSPQTNESSLPWQLIDRGWESDSSGFAPGMMRDL